MRRPKVPGPRFGPGTTFRPRPRVRHGHAPLYTVLDVWQTFNIAGVLVRVDYLCSHPGPLGQTVESLECDATVARNLETERPYPEVAGA